jgi:hypothetical protein
MILVGTELPFLESLALNPENRQIFYYKVFTGHVDI